MVGYTSFFAEKVSCSNSRIKKPFNFETSHSKN
jgi:hypothetical protein